MEHTHHLKKFSLFGVDGNQIKGSKKETRGSGSRAEGWWGKTREQHSVCSKGQRAGMQTDFQQVGWKVGEGHCGRFSVIDMLPPKRTHASVGQSIRSSEQDLLRGHSVTNG